MKEKKSRVKNPLSKSIIIGGVIFTIIFVIGIGSISYFMFNSRMMKLYTEHITGIMDLTMARIDTEDLKVCIETKEPTEKFNELMEYLDQSRTYYNMDTCTIVYPYEENGEYKVMQVLSGLLPEERYGDKRKDIPLPLLGDDLPPYLAPGFAEMIYNDFLTRYDIKYSKESNAFGSNYYAAKTIRDENNKPVAVFTTSASLAEIEGNIKQYMIVSTVAILLLAVTFMILMIEWLRRRIINPLKLMGEVADETKVPSIINEAKLYMSKNYSNPNLMLQDVAKEVNMSKSRFSTVFSQHAGQTFTEYLIYLRINKAKELLRTTQLRSSQIAEETGYNDSHYFSYIFKKNTGLTPSEYRSQYQNQPE